MITMRKMGAVAGSAALLLSGACVDLEVTNPNNPDIERALASPEDVLTLANSIPNLWYGTASNIYPRVAASVAADAYTANFGNFGMRFHNVEPRAAFLNASAGGDDRLVSQSTWNNAYADLGAANDVMIAVDNAGIDLGGENETNKARALAIFGQAASFSLLGLQFDKAFVVDETVDVIANPPEFQPYSAVLDAAMAKWDALIALTATQTEQYDASILPIGVVDETKPRDATTGQPVYSERGITSAELNQIANTMAARTLVYGARTAAETQALNWSEILGYAEKGISKTGARFDFTVVNDFDLWWSGYAYYNQEPSWMRVDVRLINLMAPTYPAKFTGTVPPAATSADARLASDFQHHGNVIGDAARGIYMQSPYSHKRYRYIARTSPNRGEGPMPHVLAAENDLIIAEALIRTNGDLARAATLINGTRVGRGNLPAATAGEGAAKLLDYIYYERMIELLGSTGGPQFYDGRRLDKLQAGTQRHWPVPATELETLAEAIYTFGGVGNPDMRRGKKNGLSLSLFGGSSTASVRPIF